MQIPVQSQIHPKNKKNKKKLSKEIHWMNLNISPRDMVSLTKYDEKINLPEWIVAG